MKFKKVEIQAFRAYNLASEGTFDFSTGTDTADFVSIYAPNGFGKTSFYDAVEWGVTHNIHRFLRRYKFNQQVAKTEKNLNDANQTSILRNKYASDELPTFVNLYTTDSDLPILNELKKPRKGQPDYKFDERDTIRGYFQEVILSQEWIDSFLKEENGSDRYQTFVRYFGDKELDLYYRTLVSLMKTNDENIKKLQKDLAGIQLNLTFEGDQQILIYVNQVITHLNENEQRLNYLDAQFSEKESSVYGSLITSRTHELEMKIEKSKQIIELIELLITGSEKSVTLDSYFNSLDDLDSSTKKIIDLEGIQQQFDNIKKSLNQESNIRNQKIKIGIERTYFENLSKQIPEYLSVIKQIQDILDQLKEQNDTFNDQSSSKVQKDGEIQQVAHQIIQHGEYLANAIKIVDSFPSLKRKIHAEETKLRSLKKTIGELENTKKDKEKLRSHAQIELDALDIFIKQIEKKQYLLPVPEIYNSYSQNIINLNNLQSDSVKLFETANNLADQIKAQRSFQTELEELIKKGLVLVNQSKTSNCPLCNQTYETYQALATKITGNELLSKALQELLIEQTKNEQHIQSNKEKQDYLLNELIAALKTLRSTSFQGINKLLNEENESKYQEDQTNASIQTSLKSISDLKAVLENRSFEEHGLWLSKRVENIRESSNQLAKRMQVLQDELKVITDAIAKIRQKIEQIQEKDRQLKANLAYNAIQDYISRQSQKVEIHENNNEIDIKLKNLITEIEKLNDKEKEITAIIAKQSKELEPYNEDSIAMGLAALKQNISVLKQTIVTYQDFAKTNLAKDISLINKDALSSLIEKSRQKEKASIKTNLDIIGLYALLGKLKEDLIPFLKYEQAKIDEKDKKDKVKFLKNILKKELENEKFRVAKHIDAQVNSFFYEDVINDLYRKIDPHPDYKAIKFICDFTDDKPQLNVCVTDEKKQTLQIPNLYFSTAQLNILSLSIFLAKALHAKDYNGKQLECIFIDDPIQSMDSINILSTIDLLRSIVVNHKRQIILSTHDANFHNLLMKKMPKELFNSKFMELETFGKVKDGIGSFN